MNGSLLCIFHFLPPFIGQLLSRGTQFESLLRLLRIVLPWTWEVTFISSRSLFPQAACPKTDHYSILKFRGPPYCFAQCLYYFTPIVSRSFHFLSLQVLVSCCAFDGSRSIRYEAISHYGSHLHIPSGTWCGRLFFCVCLWGICISSIEGYLFLSSACL